MCQLDRKTITQSIYDQKYCNYGYLANNVIDALIKINKDNSTTKMILTQETLCKAH